jgi:5' nucleotidase, deoxy (Pyrimidine), cytosolic type C protein (NT5C)
MKIYLDIDDVVADWMGYARAYLREPNWKEGEILPDTTWRRLKDDPRMYSKLPLKEGALELVNYCRQLLREDKIEGLYFLTAIPHKNDMPWAPQDKVFWGQQHFPDIPVFLGPYSDQKWMHCKPGDILIDDRTVNCEQWISAGGQSHVYRSWTQCEPWLKELFE